MKAFISAETQGTIRKPGGQDGAPDASGRGAAGAFRPGEPLAKCPDGWFARVRAARFPSTEAAAHACGIGAKLMWILEGGGVTSPEIARRVGRGMGLTRPEVRRLTCAGTAARRRSEALERRTAGGNAPEERTAGGGAGR